MGLTEGAIPDWCGLYSSHVSRCNPIECCCINGQVKVTNPTASETGFEFQFAGVCPPNVDLNIKIALPRVTTSTTAVNIFGAQIKLTLSADGYTITSDGPNPKCNEYLIRLT
ncbi:unnamed protein product [Didymodactylos carnosus]|uniref:Uncharacterized protein n=2 Tax=Didymodactylos carnosus TaxID=1234261 RepID=A0A814H1W0_9BILA|nr:unnamed protein product [Didymodactylos carnosus]CAF3775184.1 unnamed protein product [Didymodactylos carnosus]